MRQLRIILLLILPVLFSFDYPALKNDVFPGYVILDSGQKLEGLVMLGTFIERELKVKFVDRGKKVSYTAEQLQGYGYEKTEMDELGKQRKIWIHYEKMEALEPPRIFAPTNVMVEREVEGEQDLFCFYIQQRANIEKPYEYYYLLRAADGELTKVTEENFIEVLKKEFGGYTAMVERLGKKQFGFKNIGRMARDYNYWVSQKHDPVSYIVSPENYDRVRN